MIEKKGLSNRDKQFLYILKYFSFNGTHMLFPYHDDDKKYYLARIDASDIKNIIKWKHKKMM